MLPNENELSSTSIALGQPPEGTALDVAGGCRKAAFYR
jgi:hypothetical protein